MPAPASEAGLIAEMDRSRGIPHSSGVPPSPRQSPARIGPLPRFSQGVSRTARTPIPCSPSARHSSTYWRGVTSGPTTPTGGWRW
jgi:hypothetical protein